MNFGDILTEARPWLNSAGIATLLALVGRLWFTSRRLRLLEAKDDRDGYGVLIATLQSAIASMETRHGEEMAQMKADHRSALDRIEQEHRRCEERLNKLEGELAGFHRQALLASQQAVAILPASSMIHDAGRRAVAASIDAAVRDAK